MRAERVTQDVNAPWHVRSARRIRPPRAATHGRAVHRLPSGPTPGRAPRASACEPYRELIADALRHDRNAMAICQDLVDDHGFTAVRERAEPIDRLIASPALFLLNGDCKGSSIALIRSPVS